MTLFSGHARIATAFVGGLALVGCANDTDDDDLFSSNREEITIDMNVDADTPLLIDTDGDGEADAEVEAIFVTFDRIEMTRETGEVVEVETRAEVFNLLADNDFRIAKDVVPEDTYEEIRLFIGEDSEVRIAGETQPLAISGAADGLRFSRIFCIDGRIFNLDKDELEFTWVVTEDMFEFGDDDQVSMPMDIVLSEFPSC